MPWLSLPVLGSAEIKQKLSDSLQISGIPALVVLDAKTGHFISDTAKFDVGDVYEDEEKSKALIEKWKNFEAVPIEEAYFTGGGSEGLVM